NRENVSIGVIIFEIFKGISYDIDYSNLNFPAIWFFINALLIFIVSGYVNQDLKINAAYLMNRCSRSQIWTSKILWVIINVIIYYMLIFFAIFIIGNLFDIKWKDYCELNGVGVSTIKLLLDTFIIYVTTSITLCILDITLSLMINYNYSYIILIIIILISIYTKNNIFPAQHSLLLRHVPFESIHNLSVSKSVLYNLIVSIILIIISRKLILYKDII
ncbi:hypothetical protein, partial [Clostridium saccharoperbutylacetonicum]|uniref:hypothetical protein n=1 Tax=Clostridium saccharoperbutylacetonicum TaxID=36745 RepID=UPI0039EC1AC4